jgi:hypothetical protein
MEHSPSWEANSYSASQIPIFLWNPKVHYRIHNRRPPVPFLSQIIPVRASPSHYLNIHFNIILASTPRSSQVVSFPQVFPHQNLARTSSVPYTCRFYLMLYKMVLPPPPPRGLGSTLAHPWHLNLGQNLMTWHLSA